MTTQPEALRLADQMLHYWDERGPDAEKVAAELRRLHAENERLHQINQSHEMKLSVRGYQIQIEDLRLAHAELRERNAELLEALRWIERRCPAQLLLKDLHRIHMEAAHDAGACARAAIARVEGEPK
jgi:hypothetical protein